MTEPVNATPSRLAIAIGVGIAVILAVSVSAQTYLSMLDHGHSFARLFFWQLGAWSVWAVAVPFVLQQGARFAARVTRSALDSLRLVAVGAALTIAHLAVTTQLTIWVQPFRPIVTYSFRQAFNSLLPYSLAIDMVVYVLLLVVGGALATHNRARQLELRESKLEAELARAELRALRLEIEPHFLFNTLNSIAALIRLKDNARALDMLVGLGDFMRSNLDDSREPFVPLSAELDWVKRYVALQQTRFGDRLDVAYAIDPECLDIRVPTLLLQPLVENALRHGAAKQVQRCHVVIGVSLDQQQLTIRVADDGAGLPMAFDLDRQAGTGLRNTRARLEHVYGTAASLQLRRGFGETLGRQQPESTTGTTVVITLPTAVRWKGRATA